MSILYKCSKEMIRYLVGPKGADVNGEDSNGWTPLAMAVHRDNKDALELLLTELGADQNKQINIRDSFWNVNL